MGNSKIKRRKVTAMVGERGGVLEGLR